MSFSPSPRSSSASPSPSLSPSPPPPLTSEKSLSTTLFPLSPSSPSNSNTNTYHRIVSDGSFSPPKNFVEMRIPQSLSLSVYSSLCELCIESEDAAAIGSIGLHPDYADTLKTLTPIRTLFCISDVSHEICVIKMIFKILSAQFESEKSDRERRRGEGDEKSPKTPLSIFDTPALSKSVGFEHSVIPLLLSSSQFLFSLPSPIPLSENDEISIGKFLSLLEGNLTDFHQFDGEVVSRVFVIYYHLQSWFTWNCQRVTPPLPQSVIQQKIKKSLLMAVTTSSKEYYHSFFPDSPTLQEVKAKVEESIANVRVKMEDFFNDVKSTASSSSSTALSVQSNGSHESQVDRQITEEMKKIFTVNSYLKAMFSWTVKEWGVFSKGLIEALTIELKEFSPSFEGTKLFDCYADISILSMVTQLNGDVKEFIKLRFGTARRSSGGGGGGDNKDSELMDFNQNIGYDELNIAVLSCLSAVRRHLLQYGKCFTPKGKREILSSFPNLDEISFHTLNKWLLNQSLKLASLRERLIQFDDFIAIDAEGGTYYSESLNDEFSILSTIVNAFFVYLSLLKVQSAHFITQFLTVINGAVSRYLKHLIDVCGVVPSEGFIPQQSTTVKYKQSGQTGNAFFGALKKMTMGGGKDKEKEKEKETERERGKTIIGEGKESKESLNDPHSYDMTSHRDLFLRQRLSHLLVKVSCAQGVIAKVEELQQQIWGLLKNVDADNAKEEREGKIHGIPIEWWEEWQLDCSLLRSSRLKLQSEWKTEIFTSVRKELFDAVLPRLIDYISIYVVWKEWRDFFLNSLYSPSAREGMKIRHSPFNVSIDNVMRSVYKGIPEELFSRIAEGILRQMCVAYRYVVLFSRRIIEREDVYPILMDDIALLREMFSDHMEKGKGEEILHSVSQLTEIMEKHTDDIIKLVEESPGKIAHLRDSESNSQYSLDTLIRIVGLRTGKSAQKFIKKQREMQKEKEKNQLKNDKK